MGRRQAERVWFAARKSDPWPPFDILQADRGYFPHVPTTQLRADSVTLRHGTSAMEDFDIPRGPASFTTSERLAKEYALYEHDGGRPRVLRFSVKARIPRLVFFPSVHDREAYRNATGWCDHIFKTRCGGIGFQRMPELAAAVAKKGYEGVYIRNIDGGGDEVMLIHPEKYLAPA